MSSIYDDCKHTTCDSQLTVVSHCVRRILLAAAQQDGPLMFTLQNETRKAFVLSQRNAGEDEFFNFAVSM